jgi:hypothetical protein
MLKTKARIAGALFIVSIILRIFADGMVRDRYIVADDAAATAANLLAHQSLFGLGFIADVISFACYVALTAYLYEVFRPVDRTAALIGVFFNLISGTAQALSSVFQLVALSAVGTGGYLSGFDAGEQQSLILLLFRIRSIMFHNIGLVFLGVYLVLLGYLILRSRLMPWFIGVLVLVAGCAYLPFLSPPLAHALLPNLLIPVGVGQTALALLLVAFGVKESASGRGEPIGSPI